MKIFIQARKDGYNILFPTRTTPVEFYQFASDIQQESANNDAIYYGKNFYTLAFTSGGCIFTKYVIGYDIQRNHLGNVGISVFIPNTQKLSGSDVKILLDDLLNTFCRNYCPDYNLGDKREDWLLFTSLADSYDARLLSRSANYNAVITGTQNPAFHYYKSDSELIEHLDKPFQEEYSGYRQILFIDSNLQGAANPLNVLKYSGIEVNPDLKNDDYYLNNYNKSKGVKISVYYNNKWNERSNEKGNNQIREKWQVEIKYSKDYYKPIVAIGSISNHDSDIYKYIEINESNIKIKYDSFLPYPETKTFTFDVVTKKDRAKVTDAEIQIGDYQGWQKISEYTFKAEELGKEYKISARKGENLFSDVVKIIPKDYSVDSILLPLIERRVVKIKATDQENGDTIWQFKVHITGKDFNKVTDQIEFVGDEIDKEWNIQIEKRTEYSASENKKFCPAKDGNEINFKLKKAKKIPIGPIIDGNSEDKKQKSFAAKGKGFFSKPAVIATSIVSTLVLGAGIWVLCNDNQSPKAKLTAQQITTYVKGDSLMFDKIKAYKADWEEQKPEIITIDGKSWYNPTTWFVGSTEGIPDSTKYKEWAKSKQSIETAIAIRKSLNSKGFLKLKNQQYFSIIPTELRNAINKIDSTKYDEVVTQLGDVTNLTLTEISERINEILKPKEPVKEEAPLEPKKEEKKTKTKKETDRQSIQRQGATIDKAADIEKELKSATITKQKLNEYSGANFSKLKESIQLYNVFWNSVKSSTKKDDYDDLLIKVKQDDVLKKSELKNFLNSICASSADFEKFNSAKGKATSTSLKQLKSKIK